MARQRVARREPAVVAAPRHRDRKVVLCGNAQTGKSKAMLDLLQAHPRDRAGNLLPHLGYMPTIGVEVHPYRHFAGPRVGECDSIWEVAGSPLLRGHEADYYRDARLAIVYLGPEDRIRRAEDRSVQQWRSAVQAAEPNCIVVTASSVEELQERLEAPMELLRELAA